MVSSETRRLVISNTYLLRKRNTSFVRHLLSKICRLGVCKREDIFVASLGTTKN